MEGNVRVSDMADRISGLSEDERLTMSKDFLSNGKNAFNSVAGQFETIGDLYKDIDKYVKVLRQQRKQPKTIMNYLDYLKHALERIAFVRGVFDDGDDDDQRRLILSHISNQAAATRRSMKSTEHHGDLREKNAENQTSVAGDRDDREERVQDENGMCRDAETQDNGQDQIHKHEQDDDDAAADDAWSLSSDTNNAQSQMITRTREHAKETGATVSGLEISSLKTGSATQDTRLMRIFEKLPDIFLNEDIVVPSSVYRRVMTSFVDIVKIALSS